jgi:hypothetical protein
VDAAAHTPMLSRGGERKMKKIEIRKTGAVRLTAACDTPYAAFVF